MTLTPQQVAEKKFTSTRFKNGYDETEVDAFLDEVEAELTKLNDEAATLRRQLEGAQLAQAVSPPVLADAPAAATDPADLKPSQGEMEEMLRRTLLLAQRTADEVVAEARAEAEQHLGAAKAEAETLRQESEQRAAEHERSASMRASVSTAEFEATKRRLEDQIAALHAFESDFRGRLRAYLELQIGDLEATVLKPPGGAAVAAPAAPAVTSASTVAPVVPEPTGSIDLSSFAASVDVAPEDAHRFGDDGLEPPLPPRGADSAPMALPELPPLPSWMSADAGFGTDEDASTDAPPAPLPEGA